MIKLVVNDIINDLQNPEYAREYGSESAKLAFSNALYDARKRSGLTQNELALKIGSTQPYIAKLERGEANPTISVIGRIFGSLGLKCRFETESLTPQPETSTRLSDSAEAGVPGTAYFSRLNDKVWGATLIPNWNATGIFTALTGDYYSIEHVITADQSAGGVLDEAHT